MRTAYRMSDAMSTLVSRVLGLKGRDQAKHVHYDWQEIEGT